MDRHISIEKREEGAYKGDTSRHGNAVLAIYGHFFLAVEGKEVMEVPKNGEMLYLCCLMHEILATTVNRRHNKRAHK
jgi:hypothetical protein